MVVVLWSFKFRLLPLTASEPCKAMMVLVIAGVQLVCSVSIILFVTRKGASTEDTTTALSDAAVGIRGAKWSTVFTVQYIIHIDSRAQMRSLKDVDRNFEIQILGLCVIKNVHHLLFRVLG